MLLALVLLPALHHVFAVRAHLGRHRSFSLCSSNRPPLGCWLNVVIPDFDLKLLHRWHLFAIKQIVLERILNLCKPNAIHI